jgi:signal transduction histidine kinase
MAPLTHAMNGLLGRLQDALAAQRHFIADAAHQLRTPLTALKLHADEAARESDPARLAPLLAELRRAADRAVRLSNQLLTLARAEPSARVAEPRRFELRAAVHKAPAAGCRARSPPTSTSASSAARPTAARRSRCSATPTCSPRRSTT